MPAQASHSTTVLVVEDHADSREMYCELLESAGYRALGAANGGEALATARSSHPQVVVTDVSMPGMNGWEFAAALRRDARTRDIGIVAITGWTTEDLEPDARLSNVDSVLTKPCTPENLLREIRKVLARGRRARVRADARLSKARDLRERSGRLIDRSAKHAKGPKSPGR